MGDVNTPEIKDEKDLEADQERVTEVLTLEEKRKNFGAKLKALRVGLDQSERDIIHLTRISPPFIDALEDGNFDALPGEVFGRGFIKNICKVLETDPEQLLQEYNACWEQKIPKGRSTRYSRKLLTHKYRSEYRNRSSLPLTNYFSHRGLILWIVGPTILLVGGILVFVFFPTDSSEQGSVQYGNKTESSMTAVKDPEEHQTQKSRTSNHSMTPETSSQGHQKPIEDEYLSDDPVSGHDDEPGSESFQDGQASERSGENPVIETQSSTPSESLNLVNESGETGRILIKVLSDVSIKLNLDGALKEMKQWKKGSYSLSFQDSAELTVEQPEQVQIFFNGKSLGPAEGGLRDRHLSFYNSKLVKAKL